VTTNAYDGTGRLTSVTDANSVATTSITYSGTCGGGSHINCDLPLTTADSTSYVKTYAYDALDRPTSVTYTSDSYGTTELYDYTFQSGSYSGTPSLELRKYTDRLGRATVRAYDADQRLTSETDPLSHTVSYTYFKNGALDTQTDPNSNVTTWAIDVESRPTSKTFADSSAETYAYETTTSRRKSVTDALSQVKTYTYDNADEVTDIAYTASVNTTPNVKFCWDAYFSRRTLMSTDSCTMCPCTGKAVTTWSYVSPGTAGSPSPGGLQLLTEDGPYSNDALTLAYDADGRVDSPTVGGPTAETWSYDAIGRLTDHYALAVHWYLTNYQNESNRLEYRELAGTSVSMGWIHGTSADWSTLNKSYTSGTQARNFGNWYEMPGGQFSPYYLPTVYEENGNSGHPWPARNWAYTYDNDNRLLTAQVPCVAVDGGSCGLTESYTQAYDSAWNKTTLTPVNGTSSDYTQAYNSSNEMTTGYTHNSVGDRTADGTHTYTYDAENRLLEALQTGTSNTVTYTYDGLGRRLQSAYYNGSTTTNSRYQWCPPFPSSSPWAWASAPSICSKRDGSDTVLKRYYTEGEYTVSGTSSVYYERDQAGSVRDTVNSSGTLVGALDYSPFGGQLRT